MVDFRRLKESVSISQVMALYGLEMKGRGAQLRGDCPACRSGGPRALAINTEKSSYYCFSAKKGGDLISLAAHVTGRDNLQRDAAEEIALKLRIVTDSPTAPRSAPPVTVSYDKWAERLSELEAKLTEDASDEKPLFFSAAMRCEELRELIERISD